VQAVEGRGSVRANAVESLVEGPHAPTAEAKRSLGYLLLKPDVVLRGLVDRAIEALARRGFEVIDFRVGGLSDADFARLYHGKFLWDVDDWAYNQSAFRLGPVIGAVVWRSSAGVQEAVAQDYLRRIKGSALPPEVSPDSLRGEIGATSRVFNSVHVPDDFEAAIAAACAWLGQPRIACLLDAFRDGLVPRGVGAAVTAEVSRHGYHSARNLNGEAAYCAILPRLAHAVEGDLSLPADALASLRRMSLEYSALSRLLAESTATFAEQCEMMSDAFRLERFLLLQLREVAMVNRGRSWSRLAQTVELLLALGGAAPQIRRSLEFLWFLLGEWRVFVSDLEKYLVLGSLTYPSVMRAARASVHRFEEAAAL
jgi:nucleoside diphosphate kinase